MARCIEETGFFNTRLFYMNGEPMKFYLDGYYPHEIYRISKIIQAYGGECVKTSQDAIILSSLSRSNRRSNNFHEIRYLYDCVTAGKTRDLAKYAIIDANKSMIHLKKNDLQNKANGKLTQFMSKKRKLALGCANCNTLFTNVALFSDSDSGSEELHKEIHLGQRRASTGSCHNNPDEGLMSSSPWHIHSQSLKVLNPNTVLQHKTKSDDYATNENKTCEKYTDNEDRLMIEFIMKNNAYEKFKSHNFWQKAEKEKILGSTTNWNAERMRNRFRHYTIFNYDKYTDDPVALEKFAEVASKLSDRNPKRKRTMVLQQCDTTTSVHD